MESKKLEKAEALQMKSLLKEVKELKDALEMQSIKEQMVAGILQVDDREKLDKVVDVLRDVLFPRKPGGGHTEAITAVQGDA